MKEMIIMKFKTNEDDIKLLSNDKYTFFVLGKVMYGNCKMIYTDADYKASNACYEKIGYELKGKLCTIKVG